MTFGWIVQGVFAVANIGVLIGIFILRNQKVPIAQADFQLFFLMIPIGATSITSAIMSTIVGALIELKNPNFGVHLLLTKRFGQICLFNGLVPVFSFLIFPRGYN